MLDFPDGGGSLFTSARTDKLTPRALPVKPGGFSWARICGILALTLPAIAWADCNKLAPSSSPAANRANIQACVAQGRATLNSGLFRVDGPVLLGNNQTLIGAPGTQPTIRLTQPNTSNVLIRFDGSHSRVSGLNLDGGNAFGNYANSAIVTFLTGGDNQLDNSRVFNEQMPPAGHKATGVYVMGGNGGNLIVNNEIYRNFHGVIFAAPFTANTASALALNDIHDNKCDGVTLAGYGEVVANAIHDLGWECENGIPGGGIYAESNDHGALIAGNEIFNTCGHGLDLYRIAYFTITRNYVHHPGWPDGSEHSLCYEWGAVAAGLLNARENTITHNTFANEGRPRNRVTVDWNGLLSAQGAAPFSDLPNGVRVVAFMLSWNRDPAWTTTHNVIDGNTMHAPLGMFASRGTGFDAARFWDASTTNYYTNNHTQDSVRCGGNWYAANTQSCGTQSPCNLDDSRHPMAINWARNDGCYFF